MEKKNPKNIHKQANVAQSNSIQLTDVNKLSCAYSIALHDDVIIHSVVTGYRACYDFHQNGKQGSHVWYTIY